MPKILIIEDEESILMALEDHLTLEGYEVETARDGISGFRIARESKLDLVILDIMLPGMDGFEVCKGLRREGVETPILMLTSKGQEIDKVLGLELGADDYVTKPFSPRELGARIKAILRRGRSAPATADTYSFGNVKVDFRKYEATRKGEPLEMTKLEFDLLKYLIEHRHEAVSRSDILDHLWDDPGSVFPRTVDTHIANLRRKLEDDPAAPRHLIQVRGVGYRFAE